MAFQLCLGLFTTWLALLALIGCTRGLAVGLAVWTAGLGMGGLGVAIAGARTAVPAFAKMPAPVAKIGVRDNCITYPEIQQGLRGRIVGRRLPHNDLAISSMRSNSLMSSSSSSLLSIRERYT